MGWNPDDASEEAAYREWELNEQSPAEWWEQHIAGVDVQGAEVALDELVKRGCSRADLLQGLLIIYLSDGPIYSSTSLGEDIKILESALCIAERLDYARIGTTLEAEIGRIWSGITTLLPKLRAQRVRLQRRPKLIRARAIDELLVDVASRTGIRGFPADVVASLLRAALTDPPKASALRMTVTRLRDSGRIRTRKAAAPVKKKRSRGRPSKGFGAFDPGLGRASAKKRGADDEGEVGQDDDEE